MPRHVELGSDRLVVHLTGLLHVGALTGRFEIRYADIESVSTEPFRAPPGTLRLVGTSLPFTDIREGRFVHGGEWFFLSYEHSDRTVTLRLHNPDLGGTRYQLAVLGDDHPRELAAAIEERRRGDRPLA